MPRPHHAKVAVVQSCDLGLIQPLSHRQDGRIDKSNVGVAIRFHQLQDAVYVGVCKAFNSIDSRDDILKQHDRPFAADACRQQVIDFR